MGPLFWVSPYWISFHKRKPGFRFYILKISNGYSLAKDLTWYTKSQFHSLRSLLLNLNSKYKLFNYNSKINFYWFRYQNKSDSLQTWRGCEKSFLNQFRMLMITIKSWTNTSCANIQHQISVAALCRCAMRIFYRQRLLLHSKTPINSSRCHNQISFHTIFRCTWQCSLSIDFEKRPSESKA